MKELKDLKSIDFKDPKKKSAQPKRCLLERGGVRNKREEQKEGRVMRICLS